MGMGLGKEEAVSQDGYECWCRYEQVTAGMGLGRGGVHIAKTGQQNSNGRSMHDVADAGGAAIDDAKANFIS